MIGQDVITLSHGAGGKAFQELLHTVIEQHFGQNVSAHDQARLANHAGLLAVTTDSFVVTPRFFPGGNIGCLSVYGTVNDLVVGGAKPVCLTVGLIIEEGFSIKELNEILSAMSEAAKECDVQIVTGDTKVVPRGACEGLFINTTGVGIIDQGRILEVSDIQPSDCILVSGDIGRHGACIASVRQDIAMSGNILSDCSSLKEQALALAKLEGVRYMRDATRGGVAAVLNELSQDSGFNFDLDEAMIPISNDVRSLCEIVGFNPLHLANEGRLIAIVAESSVAEALASLVRSGAHNAAVIGKVSDINDGTVTLTSYLGAKTVLATPAGELLPRIC